MKILLIYNYCNKSFAIPKRNFLPGGKIFNLICFSFLNFNFINDLKKLEMSKQNVTCPDLIIQ